MRAKEGRLLDVALIPPSLWDAATSALRLSPALAQAYDVLIKRHGLQDLAGSRDPEDPPIGGLTKERTDQHFAQAFDGSVARAQLALLDPRGELTPAPDPYLISLAGNRLSFTDAPCGAGAAAFAFLSTVAELRACKVLPRQPLDVFLLGAELSETAREYAQEMLNQLRETLQAQAIFVEAEFLHWNVTDPLSNTDLIRRMTQVAMAHPKRLLVVANFNALLEKERKRKVAEPQLGELFRHASGTHSVAIWIEPNMNRAIAAGGLFPWLINVLKKGWRRFARARTDSAEPVSTASAQFYTPLSPAATAPVRLAVMPIDLVRSE